MLLSSFGSTLLKLKWSLVEALIALVVVFVEDYLSDVFKRQDRVPAVTFPCERRRFRQGWSQSQFTYFKPELDFLSLWKWCGCKWLIWLCGQNSVSYFSCSMTKTLGIITTDYSNMTKENIHIVSWFNRNNYRIQLIKKVTPSI